MVIKNEISDIIYDELDYVYCTNCRYASKDPYDYCDDCHRKYMGWSVARAECDKIADKIIDILNEDGKR